MVYLHSKLILSFVFAALITSCASVKPPQTTGRQVEASAIDFREYSDNGFLFTTNPPSGNYESKGIIRVEIRPEVIETSISFYSRYKENGYAMIGDKPYSVQRFFMNSKVNYYGIEQIDLKPATDELYNQALEFDSDAITNFSINRSLIDNEGLIYYNIEVSGFAIDRK